MTVPIVEDNRHHRNKADYGIAEYREFYEDKYLNGESCKNYSKIITEFNNQLIDSIFNDDLSYTIPFLLFEITIRKEKRIIRIKEGKLINNNPIDWKATNALWDKDEEAKNLKLKVRHDNYNTSGYIFRIYLKKFKSRLKHRSYFKIKPNRQFQRGLTRRINDSTKEPFDAFLLYKHEK